LLFIIIIIIIINLPQVVKIPGLKTKRIKSKSWMAIDPASRQSECRAKARNWSTESRQKCVGINTLSLWHLQSYR